MHALIRKMAPTDHPAVSALWRAAGLTEEPEDSAADVGALLDSAHSAAFVAVERDIIVGAVLCGSDGRYGYIHHLAVAPGRRRSGLGHTLVRTCLHYLSMRHVLVLVRDSNDTALQFWQRAGFVRAEGLGVHYLRNDAFGG